MKVTLLILSALFSVQAFCQEGRMLQYSFVNLSEKDGLAGPHVMSVTQDEKGFLWLSTRFDGIQRYDGVRFKQSGEAFFESETNTYDLLQLSFFGGRLVAFSGAGRYIFNRYTNRFVANPPALYSEKEVFFDEEGLEWIVTKEEVRSGGAEGRVRHTISSDLVGHNSRLVLDTLYQQFWFADDAYFVIMDRKTKRAFRSVNEPALAALGRVFAGGGAAVANTLMDRHRRLWISTWQGKLFRYDLNTGVLKEYPLRRAGQSASTPVHVTCFMLDRYDALWCGSYGAGLLRYNKETDRFDYVPGNVDEHEGLRYNFEISVLYQDADDNIWVGTDVGLSIFNPYRDEVQVLRQGGQRASLPSSEITSVLESTSKDIWVSTWGSGVLVLDSNLQLKRRYSFPESRTGMVWAIAEDRRGRIWIGCQAGVIRRYDPISGSFSRPFYIPGSASTIRVMTNDRQGNIYLGTHHGMVAKWDAATDSFLRTPLLQNPVLNLLIDDRQRLWVNTGAMLYLCDRKTMLYTDSVYLLSKNSGGLPDGLSGGMASFSDSLLILSSYLGKAGVYNVNSRQFFPWKTEDGVFERKVAAVQTDPSGKVWFSSGIGVYGFTLGAGGQMHALYQKNIRINTAFKDARIIRLADGRWVTFTPTELISFGRRNEGRRPVPQHPVQITGFKVRDQLVEIDSLIDHGLPVHLTYRDNFLSIHFSPMQVLSSRRTQYEYKLTGTSQAWITADDHFQANYTNLRPGKYVFMVRPKYSTDEAEITRLSIAVAPPLWETWWFYLILIALSVYVLWRIIKTRIAAVRKSAAFRQRILETEMAALRAQMNPHFIFNCISAIDNLIQKDEKDKATTYLARFAKLIRNVLDSSKAETVPFHKDFETTKLFVDLEQFRSSGSFSYTMHADDDLLNGDYRVPPMLMQPFIENAIRHGLMNKESGNRFLSIDVRLEGHQLVYTIEDNGVGRARAEELRQLNMPEHISYGIEISRQRIRNHNLNARSAYKDDGFLILDLYQNDVPCGTRVQLKLNISPV